MADVTMLPAGVAAVEHALAEGLDALGDWIVEEARRSAPVLTGEFRDSIHVERDGEGVQVISDSDHAAYVEFGTNDTRAQPTITPAFTAGMSHLQEIVGGRMAEELQ